MSTINREPYSSPKNINLKGSGTTGRGGILRFTGYRSTNPLESSANGLYVNSSNQLVFASQGSTTVIGGSGSGATPSWETLYGADATFVISSGGWTISGTSGSSTDVVTFLADAATSGDVIQITNSGSGKDINGTSNTWSVSKAGAAVFASLSISGTAAAITTTGAAAWVLLDNSATSLIIGSVGATAMITFDTTDSAEVVKFGKNLTVTDGLATLISTSNTVQNLLITNNTASTWGFGAASAGVAVIRSTSLTTGTLLKLQLTEGTLNGGYYLELYDVTAGSAVLTIGEDGVTTIAGVGGSDVLTVTAGDVVFSDASITLTDADNAATFSATNNTATTANVFVFTGSGVHTGTGATSFFKIVQSGATTGEVVSIIANGLTTGTALSVTSTGTIATTGELVSLAANTATTATAILRISATGLTDGYVLEATGGGANFTSTGGMFNLLMGAATVGAGIKISTTGVYTGAGLLQITANSATTGTVSVITANGLTTGHGLTITSSGVITTTGDLISIIGNSATTSTGLVRISATGMTTGSTVLVTGGGANMTSAGKVIEVAMGAATAGNGITITSTGVYATGSSGLLNVTANSATTTTGLVQVSSTGLTSGSVVLITGGGANMTSGGKVIEVAMGAATAGQGISVISTGVYATGSAGLVNITGNSATTTTGLLQVSGTGLTSGSIILATGGGASMTSGGKVVEVAMGAATTGVGVSITTTGVYTGTTGILDINAASATTGTIVDVGVAGLTTGIALSIIDANALTTGSIARFISNSSDTSTRNLAFIHNDHASANGVTVLALRNDAATSTNFRRMQTLSNGTQTVTFWMSDGSTSPNTALTGTAGDVCYGADSGKSYYCTGTTNWTAF